MANCFSKITLLFTIITLANLSCASVREADSPISSKAPSSDVNSPVPMKVGEVVNGRLGNSDETGKHHFWLVDLPAGNYKFVLDVRRADDQNSLVGGSLEWFSLVGEKLDSIGRLYDTDNRHRGVYRFVLKEPMKRIVRYGNGHTVSDYWLGLFQQPAQITSPFFVRCPKVEPLKLGQSVTTTLDGSQPLLRDAYYSITLPAGDYRVSTDFRREDNQKNLVGGSVAVLDTDGDTRIDSLLYAYDRDFSTKKTAKLLLADEAPLIFKVRASHTSEVLAFAIEKWPDQ